MKHAKTHKSNEGANELASARFSAADVVACAVFALAFGAACVLPPWAQGGLGLGAAILVALAIAVVVGTALVLITRFLRRRFQTRDGVAAKCETASGSHAGSGVSPLSKAAVVAIYFAILLPALLAMFAHAPGFLSLDSLVMIDNSRGIYEYANTFRYTGPTNAHSVLYIFLLGLFMQPLPTWQGVALFLLFQAACLSAIFTWAIVWLARLGVPRPYWIAVLVFFVINPVIAVYSVTLWKDVLYSAFVLVLSLKLFDWAKSPTIRLQDYLAVDAVVLALVLLRNTGLYVGVLALACAILAFKGQRARTFAHTAALVAVVMVVQGPVYTALGMGKAHSSEMLSVPLQQLSAVVAHDGSLSEEQRVFLDQLLPIEQYKERYKPESVNDIKFSPDFNDAFLEGNMGSFLRVWVAAAPANLSEYAKAWVGETRGYWQPGAVGFTFAGWPDWDAKETVNLFGGDIKWINRVNGLMALAPIVYSAGSMAWFTLLAILLLFVARGSRRLADYVPFVPPLVVLLILLVAAPIDYDFRYVYCLELLLPFLPLLGGLVPIAGRDVLE